METAVAVGPRVVSGRIGTPCCSANDRAAIEPQAYERIGGALAVGIEDPAQEPGPLAQLDLDQGACPRAHRGHFEPFVAFGLDNEVCRFVAESADAKRAVRLRDHGPDLRVDRPAAIDVVLVGAHPSAAHRTTAGIAYYTLDRRADIERERAQILHALAGRHVEGGCQDTDVVGVVGGQFMASGPRAGELERAAGVGGAGPPCRGAPRVAAVPGRRNRQERDLGAGDGNALGIGDDPPHTPARGEDDANGFPCRAFRRRRNCHGSWRVAVRLGVEPVGVPRMRRRR